MNPSSISGGEHGGEGAGSLAQRLPIDPYKGLRETSETVSIAVDSTGVKDHRAGGWVERKHGKRHVKLHFAVDIESKEVVAMEISTDDLHDVKAFSGLIVEAGDRTVSG